MIRLLKVELKKIFKRKSIYIIWGLMLIFCLLNNILYFTDYDDDGNYKYLEINDIDNELDELNEEITKYSKDDISTVTMYITLKTKIDILTLKQNYKETTWQYNKINDYLYDTIYEINYYKYVDKNNELLKEKEEEYNKILKEIDNDNYLYFLKLEIKNNEEEKKYLEYLYDNEQDEMSKQDLKTKIDDINFYLKILNIRLNNNIKDDSSYLNKALKDYYENYKMLKYYKKIKNLTYEEKLIYQEALENTSISKYIIENKVNVNKENTLNYCLRTIIEDYEIFIVILTLIIGSIIICDEFKDGTIKLLLIKPYSRGKILLSKYLTAIIVIILTIFYLIILEFIIGGIILGFASLNIPVLVYNFKISTLIEYSIFKYMILRIIVKIPFILILLFISILLSVIFGSTIISFALPLMLYMFSPTLTYMTNKYSLEFMKYLVNINWNLNESLFGRLPEISYINFNFSLVILSIYLIILVILTFIIFKRKNIKNI